MKELLIIVCLFFSVNLFAQLPTPDVGIRRNSIGISVGMRQVKELNLLPKIHSGVSWGLAYNNHRQGEGSIRWFNVEAGYASLRTRYEGASASQYIQFATSWAYNFKVWESKDLTFYAGPQAGMGYGLGFYPNWDDSHLYWSDYLGVGATGLVSYKSGSGTWLLNASLPFFSIISRPEKDRAYKIDDVSPKGILQNMNSHWESAFWNKNTAAKVGIDYLFPSAQKLSQSIGYVVQFGYMKADTGLPVYQLQHSLAAKLYF